MLVKAVIGSDIGTESFCTTVKGRRQKVSRLPSQLGKYHAALLPRAQQVI